MKVYIVPNIQAKYYLDQYFCPYMSKQSATIGVDQNMLSRSVGKLLCCFKLCVYMSEPLRSVCLRGNPVGQEHINEYTKYSN